MAGNNNGRLTNAIGESLSPAAIKLTVPGVLLLREQARRIRLFERMADCFSDRRDPTRTVHTLPALLAQRVAGIALGYEDINDHDALRHNPRASSSPIAAASRRRPPGKARRRWPANRR